MSEDIKTRLQDSAAECLKSYEVWSESKKDSSARETLHAAVHELRKVASRLEIELAVSDRDQNTQKKIPIPTHRDSGRRHHNKDENISDGEQSEGAEKKKPSRPRRRAPAKKASGDEQNRR